MPWVREPLRERWADPPRSDLRLIAHAISGGWLDHVDDDFRQAVVDLTMGVVDAPANTRHMIAAVRIFIAADARDLDLEIAALEQTVN
ncbi:MAG: hypothetical protein WCS70_15295 [Verrucomicrobiota bacterium]